MSAPPFMQLYVADYLGDTRHLTTEQHGAYLLLLMAMWRAGGALPNDPAKLARIAGLSGAKWTRIEGDILEFFYDDGGDLKHVRVQKELGKAREISQKRSRSGSKGGISKSLKNKEPPLASATALLPTLPQHTRAGFRDQISDKSSEDKSSAENSIDPDADAWVSAVRILKVHGAMTEPSARRFFGRLLSANGLVAKDMLAAIGACTANRTHDPQSYLSKAAQAIKGRRPDGSQLRVGFV